MAFNYKSCYSGRLPNTKTTLYTSIGETAVKQLHIAVAVAGAYVVNIYFKPSGGSSRLLTPLDFPMDSGDATKAAQSDVVEQTMEMEAGDEIEGECDTADVIDCVISGATR